MDEHIPKYTREHGPLELPIRVLRFEDQIGMLKREPAWQNGDRVAKTLVKEGKLRAVLTLMRSSTELHRHKHEGASTIECLTGRLKLHFLDSFGIFSRSIELVPGELVALDGGVEHTIEAVHECAFLVTIAQ